MVKVIISRRFKVPRVMDLVWDLTLCTLQHNHYFRSSSACPWDQSQHCRLSYSFPDESLPPASIPCQRNTRSHPSSSVQSLAEEAKHYLKMVLSSSTKNTYSSGMRQFVTFGSQMNVYPQLPVKEEALINFSVAMARSVQYTAI